MNMMKRFTAVVLMLCLALSLSACGGSGDSNVETTEAPETAAPTEATVAVEETEAPVEETDSYKVTVVDEAGNPIAGAMVQLCMDTCFPSVTNESGVAEFALDEADYKVSFLAMPAGYTYSTEEQEFYFEDGSKELTITLKAEE